MTTLGSPPGWDAMTQPSKPVSRWRRLIPGSRRGKSAVAGGMALLLVAGLLCATYETSPGGTLWGAEKTVFPEHAQDVALAAVVDDLKKAQGILGSGQQPTPDELTDARTALNQAKQNMGYLSPSAEQASLQSLYLQLTQQLLQYTPDSVQQLPALPAPPPVEPDDAAQPPDAAALTSATAPSWGYLDNSAGTDYGPPPQDVPDAPGAGWPQPYAAPLTPNLDDQGYYDPSWGQLYGYDQNDWYDYDLSGYNQYGYDFLGYDRWGYDRSGYDRWGYDHWGYTWAGCNWAGYDHDGWDRNGRNEWGQRRGYPGDPRDQGWYDQHHPYEQYYQWKFQNVDPVYARTQWDQAHGFNPNQYKDWNKGRDWRDPRNRDWAPLAATSANVNVDIHATSPVVNLNASLAQFISNDKSTSNSGPLMKDLADKSTGDFTRELVPRATSSFTSPPSSELGRRPATPSDGNQTPFTPPALTAPVPTTPPSKVPPGFTAPTLAPVPVYVPPKLTPPQSRSKPAPEGIAPADPGPVAIPPTAGLPNPVAAPPADPAPATPPDLAADPSRAQSGSRRDPIPQTPASDPQSGSGTPTRHEAPLQQTAPEAPAQDAPAPEVQPRAPRPRPAAPEAPVQQAPAQQAPTHQAPPQRAPEVAPAPPVHEAPPVRPAPPPAPRAAPSPPPPRPAPAPRAPRCVMPTMC